MPDLAPFKEWLKHNKGYKEKVACDIISRLKRAQLFIDISKPTDYEVFCLDKNLDFKQLTISVRSQIRRAIRLFITFNNERSSI